ncbi:MAG: 3-phosphoshikimate 1-carboxyvinyltransferase [Candidatus Odinarchaeia archaeon]
MVNIMIMPVDKLKGEVEAPPSKSHTHRILVASLLSKREVKIINPLIAGDVNATVNACKLFGAVVEYKKNILKIIPPEKLKIPEKPINAFNSATTIRFMASVAALIPGRTTLTGSESLKQRPMVDLINSLRELNVNCNYLEKEGYPPFNVEGGFEFGGKTTISGSISSQFISSLLLALPYAKKDSTVKVIPPLISKPYIEMTLDIIKKGNVLIKHKNLYEFTIPGKQKYDFREYTVPGDFSSTSFLMAAAAITNSKIIIKNIDFNSIHPDRKIVEYLTKMGVKLIVKPEKREIIVESADLNGARIYCGDNPDLIPVLTIVALYSKGKTILYGAEHVRFKETNRLSVLANELKKCGVKIKETKTGLSIEGVASLKPSEELNSYGDHRMFMAFCLAGLKAEKPLIIKDSESYKDSYPGFIRDLEKLGVKFKGV